MRDDIQISIGRENAIALNDAKWWQGLTPRQIAKFQMFTAELCMPFDIFAGAVEKTVGYSVFTHMFVTHFDVIAKDILGNDPKPTVENQLEILPKPIRDIVKI